MVRSKAEDAENALRLQWTFGFNNRLVSGVHNLSDGTRFSLFYVSAHSGVIYDAAERTQLLLQGHKNPITATCVSADRRFIATGDTGPDSLIVVWDARLGIPLKTYFNPHPHGVASLDMSRDGRFLASLSAKPPAGEGGDVVGGNALVVNAEAPPPQTLSLWAWANDSEEEIDNEEGKPMLERQVPAATSGKHSGAVDYQHCVRFSPWNSHELVSNGVKTCFFWSWYGDGTQQQPMDGGSAQALGLEVYAPLVDRAKFGQALGVFTQSCFLAGAGAGGGKAVTGTRDGDVVVWEMPSADALEDTRARKGRNNNNGGGGEEEDYEGAEDAEAALVERSAGKLLHLSEGALTCVDTVFGGGGGGGGQQEQQLYLCLAGEDGAVRFYDMHFRLEAWFEDMEAGPITSISFSTSSSGGNKDGGASSPTSGNPMGSSKLDFTTPDFCVGTLQAYVVLMEAALFEEVDPDARRGTLLVQGMSDEAHGVAMHPKRSELVIACYSGAVFLWDYDSKVLLMVRQFDATKLRPRTLCFDPSGQYLMVGFTSGSVKLLESSTLEDVANFKNGRDPVTLASFSPRGNFFAYADSSHHVYLHQLVVSESTAATTAGAAASDSSSSGGSSSLMGEGGGPSSQGVRATWTYLGRYKSHSAPITALEFGLRESGEQCLVSVGEDRFMVDYDLEESSVSEGVLLLDDPRRIEQTSVPTAACWHPLLGVGEDKDFEDRIVTCNSEYKFLQWNADNKSCRKTSLGPTVGMTGPVVALKALVPEKVKPSAGPGGDEASVVLPPLSPSEQAAKAFCVYAAAHQVVGLLKMPFDGNPAKSVALVAHPNQVSCVCVSRDAALIATSGGADCTVNLWSVHPEVVDRAELSSFVPLKEEPPLSRLVSTAVLPFVRQLEGGGAGEPGDGSELDALIDFFYYAQLRTQGEGTTLPRDVKGSVPLSEVPNLMCALGHYPSESEALNMVNELKYSEFTSKGLVKDQCSLEEFVKLFVNHRPVFGVDKQGLEAAFKLLASNAADAASVAATAAAQAAAGKHHRHHPGHGGEGAFSPAATGTSQPSSPFPTSSASGGAFHQSQADAAAASAALARYLGESGALEWATLKGQLTSAGEAVGNEELIGCLRALTGLDDLPEGPLGTAEFVENVLGFEEDGEGGGEVGNGLYGSVDASLEEKA